jgi:hypothetical protein
MWRPAHGATSRPGPCRPASGYGRALGRPGPRAGELPGHEERVGALDPSTFAALVQPVAADVGAADVEAPARVTP